MALSPLDKNTQDLDSDTDHIDRKAQKIADSERVAVVNTLAGLGLITIAYGLYLHALDRAYQVPKSVRYFCTDSKGKFQAWPIAARITIDGLQHPIPSTGDNFLDAEIAAALKKLSGMMLTSRKLTRPFEDHWPTEAELFLLKNPDNPLADVDFKLGWAGGGMQMGSCNFGDLRAMTQSGRELKKYDVDLPNWVKAKKQR